MSSRAPKEESKHLGPSRPPAGGLLGLEIMGWVIPKNMVPIPSLLGTWYLRVGLGGVTSRLLPTAPPRGWENKMSYAQHLVTIKAFFLISWSKKVVKQLRPALAPLVLTLWLRLAYSKQSIWHLVRTKKIHLQCVIDDEIVLLLLAYQRCLKCARTRY